MSKEETKGNRDNLTSTYIRWFT